MLKRKILPFMLLLASVTAHAYDFSVVLTPSQTLYFNIVAGGVEVVYPNGSGGVNYAWSGYTKPTGDLVVPASVEYGGVVYSVRSVGRYAFRQCTGLTSVTLSEGVATVDTCAFYGCSGVTSLSFPSTVVMIGNGACSQMTSLADVWMAASVPPVTTGNVFSGVDLAACTLHVPCGVASAYASAAPWSGFGTQANMPCEVHIGVHSNDSLRGSVAGSGSYAVGTTVMLSAMPAESYSFICWNDGDTLNPRLVQATEDVDYTAMFFALTGMAYVHDTVHDTLMPTFYTLSVITDDVQLGVGVGSAVLPAGTQVEVCGLPLEGARFLSWDDGVTDNPRLVTVTGSRVLKALFAPMATAAVAASSWSASVDGRRLTVCCETGMRLRLYDMQGRCHSTLTARNSVTELLLPAAGVWLLQVGDGAARKIVVEQ